MRVKRDDDRWPVQCSQPAFACLKPEWLGGWAGGLYVRWGFGMVANEKSCHRSKSLPSYVVAQAWVDLGRLAKGYVVDLFQKKKKNPPASFFFFLRTIQMLGGTVLMFACLLAF